MSKFHYDTDELGYEIENLGANHRLFPPKNSSLHSFTEPDLKKGVYSCDPPTVTPRTGIAGVYRVDPDGAGPLRPQDRRVGSDGRIHYTIPANGTTPAQNWSVLPDGTNYHQDTARPPAPPGTPPAREWNYVGTEAGRDYFYKRAGGNYVIGSRAAATNPQSASPESSGQVTATRAQLNSAITGVPDNIRNQVRRIANRPPSPTNPNAVSAAPTGTPEMGRNETRLREALRGRGLQDGEIDAFMARFPADGPGRAHTTRENKVADYLQPTRGPDRRNAAHKPETMEAPALRANIRDNLRDRALTNMRNARPPVSDQQAYDYLASQGLIDTSRTPRPSTASPLTRTTGNDWSTRELNPSQARELASNPVFTPSPGTITSAGLTEDIQRHHYVNAARERYVAWAQRPRDAAENPGLGLNAEQANARFNERAEQLQLMKRNPDGSYSVRNDWNPNDTRADSPVQSFFRNNSTPGQAVRFQSDGTILPEDAATFRHENPITADPANPVDRVARQAASVQVNHDAYYVSLTGRDPDGDGPMRVVEEGGKHYLVGPDPSRPGQELRQEIRVMGPPPLTPDEARAVMQAQNLTDQDGRPLPGVTADNFTSRLGQIQTGSFGRNQALYQAAQWERGQIPGILSRAPYNKSPQEITRYMQSRGWLGDNADVGQMERFRREASGATPGSTEATRIGGEVTRAGSNPANEPQDLTERDRAANIRTNLSTATQSQADRNAAEGRHGREAGSRDAAANRSSQERIARMNNESNESVHRDDRESQRAEGQRQRDFQEAQNRLQREHDSAEKALDRKMQMMQAMIQFLGQMISAALQALSGAHQANMQALAGVNQATFSRFNNRG